MRIGSIYPTFIYNTNYVSARSLDRVNAIPNDVLKSKIGYTSSSQNTNPLRPGTSKDFAGIIASQMALGRRNAARIMKQPQTTAQSDAQSENRLAWPSSMNKVQNAVDPMAALEA